MVSPGEEKGATKCKGPEKGLLTDQIPQKKLRGELVMAQIKSNCTPHQQAPV